MAERPTGRLYVWEHDFLFAVRHPDNQPHEHYAMSLFFAVEGRFRVEPASGEARECEAALLPSGLRHRLVAGEGSMIIIQIDPDSLEGEPLRRMGTDSVQVLPSPEASLLECLRPLFVEAQDCSEVRRLLDRLLEHADASLPGAGSHSHSLPEPDERILRVLDYLRELEEWPAEINTSELAHRSGLSEGRFRHLFKEQLGLPVRRMLLWLRLRRAASMSRDGSSLTEAAHAAGFFDSAHFSRVFKQHFGHNPASILRSPDIDVQFCAH